MVGTRAFAPPIARSSPFSGRVPANSGSQATARL